jgi:molecular chaperone DnaK
MADDNKSLGNFILDGIPPGTRGTPQIEVTFDVDANGILSVKAKEKITGKEQSIRIEASSGLSDEEVKRMQQEAEANAESDKQKKELAEAKNHADALIHTAEKSLRDADGKISDELKKEIDDKIATLKSKKDSANLGELQTLTEDLSTTLQKIGEEMSRTSAQTNPEETDEKQAEEPKD